MFTRFVSYEEGVGRGVDAVCDAAEEMVAEVGGVTSAEVYCRPAPWGKDAWELALVFDSEAWTGRPAPWAARKWGNRYWATICLCFSKVRKIGLHDFGVKLIMLD